MFKVSGCVHRFTVFSLLVTLIGWLVFLPPAQASDLGLEEVDCRCCHGASLADRHHLLVPEAGLECLSCHALTFNESSFQYDVAVVRNCLECHSGSLADRHHLLVNQKGYECLDCHALEFNSETFSYETVFNFFCEAETVPGQTPVATVTGTVRDQNGRGLAWATVTTEDGSSSALTAENGDYQLTEIAATHQTLFATLSGYSGEQQSLSVVAPLTSAVNFTLASQPVEKCGDGLENLADDCADTVCNEDSDCLSSAEEQCGDGLDNDVDGLIDCEDSDCSTTSRCISPPVEICFDGLDNDDNGQTDCADSKCLGYSACVPSAKKENCGNFLDDDNDGQIDCKDSECKNDFACNLARSREFCANGFDDDGDGLSDCQDPDCRKSRSCLPPPVAGNWDYGIDGNASGRLDRQERKFKKVKKYRKRKFALRKFKKKLLKTKKSWRSRHLQPAPQAKK